jgi:tetratricopeptide (TPR) repeat protein
VARKGAATFRRGEETDRPTASEVWREAATRAGNREAWSPDEVWVQDAAPAQERTERSRSGGPAPAGSADAHRRNVPAPVVEELTTAAGVARGNRLAARLAEASHAYDHERYQEARRILRPLADEVTDAPAVRELYGLTLYRLGQWQPAARELEAYRTLTGGYDQHPVLADCYRALHRYPDAEALWDDLREASPDADLVAEGRIVAAGCRADRGDLPGAIGLLEKSSRRVDHPRDRHLRQWYVLADLYERAGDLPKARELFGRVAGADPDAFDVRQRRRALR